MIDYHTVSVLTNVTELLCGAILGAHDSRGGERGHGGGQEVIRDVGGHPKASPSLRGLRYVVSKVAERPPGARDAGTVMVGLISGMARGGGGEREVTGESERDGEESSEYETSEYETSDGGDR